MSGVSLINLAIVGIFGMILSAVFSDISWTTRNCAILICCEAVMLIAQGMIWFLADPSLVEYLYPLITHIPLAVVLCMLNKRCLWPAVSVLTAYFCCQIRRWLALFVVAVCSGDTVMQDITEMLITMPLLFLLLRFVAPAVRSVSHYKTSVQCQFGIVPFVYYGFDYLTCIYTNILLEGKSVVVEFMPFICCVAYLGFVYYISAAEQERIRLEQERESLNMQIAEAVREIETLRKLQQKTREYRHDLRHHMQYITSCIKNDRIEQAQTYMQEICSEMEADQVVAFCKNEVVNLIFSSYVGRAHKHGITIKVRAVVPENLPVSDRDLCVLLSNALENALHACRELREEGRSCMIEVAAFLKKGKLLLQIANSCKPDIVFESGIPVANNPGHGIGVRSICDIVQKYRGLYSFRKEEDRFILQICL